MYTIQIDIEGRTCTVWYKPATEITEAEVYNIALALSEHHIGHTFRINKGFTEIAKFICVDAPNPTYWAGMALQLLNGGPLKESLKDYLLAQLERPTNKMEVH